MLRAIQLGLRLTDLDALNFGDVIDMITESANDSYDWPRLATKTDFERF